MWKCDPTNVKMAVFAKKIIKIAPDSCMLKVAQVCWAFHLTNTCLEQNILSFG